MKKSEIKVDGLYRAKVSGMIVTVKVLEIIKRDTVRSLTRSKIYRKAGTSYRVLNTKTNRETTFRSATKFREAVPQ